MDQKTHLEVSTVDRGDDLVREYVAQLENNIEWWKEQCAILQTQKELAKSKVSFLEMKVMQLQEIIRQLQNKQS